MSNSTVLRIHPTTRPKLNALRAHYPTRTFQNLIDDSIEAFAKANGIDLKAKRRKPPTLQSAA